ncbi:MAG TPA: hypothetical protein VHY31_07515 [Streptosporangiaceae bacterium]|nr:hypothetical protein [Streptosporangiaceae bacterium]
MTPASQTAAALDIRLATRISEPVDKRLRLAALVRRMPLGQFLDLVLDGALPPVDQLADQIRGGTTDEH